MSRLCATGLVNGEWEQLMAAIFAVSMSDISADYATLPIKSARASCQS